MSHRRQGSYRAARLLALPALLGFASGPVIAATQWGSYQWQAPPTNLSLYENVVLSATGTDWTTFLNSTSSVDGKGGQGAAQDWSDPRTNGLVGFSPKPENASVDRRKCPARTGEVEVCNNTYGRNGWLGVAQIWVNGDFIQKGSVKLNDTYFDMSAYSSPGWKYLVACQEVGHTLGLSHDDTTFGDTNYGTCMDYTSYPDNAGSYYDDALGQSEPTLNNREPNDNDYGLLVCMYSGSCLGSYANAAPSTGGSGGGGNGHHGHGKPQGGPTDFGIRVPGQTPPVDFLAVDAGNSPTEWGKAVAFTADGRGRVFEREIAPGRKIITEVFWAPH